MKCSLFNNVAVSPENKNNFQSEILIEMHQEDSNTSMQVLCFGAFEIIGEDVPQEIHENFTE